MHFIVVIQSPRKSYFLIAFHLIMFVSLVSQARGGVLFHGGQTKILTPLNPIHNSLLSLQFFSRRSFSKDTSRLYLHCWSSMIPHPSKKAKGGEDALFVSNDQLAVGVADGKEIFVPIQSNRCWRLV